MKKLLLILIPVLIFAGGKTPKSLQPYLDKKVFVEKDCFATDSTHFYQIAFIDGSGSYGFGLPDTLKPKQLKEVADSVMSWAYQQRDDKINNIE